MTITRTVVALFAAGLLGAILLLWSHAAAAQGRPLRLVCFELEGLTRSLDRATNEQQLLRAAPELRSGSCDWVDVPSGSTARYLGVHQGDRGFLFPLYRVTYATTGQRMYAVDGMFRKGSWRVVRQLGLGITLIAPTRCDVLDTYLSVTGRTPSYLLVPLACRVEIIE